MNLIVSTSCSTCDSNDLNSKQPNLPPYVVRLEPLAKMRYLHQANQFKLMHAIDLWVSNLP